MDFDPGLPVAGLDDRLATRDDMAPWAAETAGGFVLRPVAGDHFFITGNQAAFSAMLAEELEAIVAQLEAGPRRAVGGAR